MSSKGRERELMDWVEGVLSPAARASVDAHLRVCPECRALVRDLQGLSAGLERLHPAESWARRRLGARVPSWAAAAAVLAMVVAGFALLRGRFATDSGNDPGGPVPTAQEPAGGPGARQLEEVLAALRPGSAESELLALHARTSRSVPVRLAAVAGTPDRSGGMDTGDLIAAFEAEEDLMVRLWLVVEVARSRDPAAAARVRSMVEAQGSGAPLELRAAVGSYLTEGAARRSSS